MKSRSVLLIIICMVALCSCKKQPVVTPVPHNDVVTVDETSVFALVQEAKRLGFEGREIDTALDDGKEGLINLINKKKN